MKPRGSEEKESSPFLFPPLALASPFACCSRVTSRDSPSWGACSQAKNELLVLPQRLSQVRDDHVSSFESRENMYDAFSYFMLLFFIDQPTFRVTPSNVEKYPQEAAIFACSATGIPKPTITWFHNGAKVVPSPAGRIQINSEKELKFTSLQSGDAGTVQCVATNDAGEAISAARLNISGKFAYLMFMVSKRDRFVVVTRPYDPTTATSVKTSLKSILRVFSHFLSPYNQVIQLIKSKPVGLREQNLSPCRSRFQVNPKLGHFTSKLCVDGNEINIDH